MKHIPGSRVAVGSYISGGSYQKVFDLPEGHKLHGKYVLKAHEIRDGDFIKSELGDILWWVVATKVSAGWMPRIKAAWVEVLRYCCSYKRNSVCFWCLSEKLVDEEDRKEYEHTLSPAEVWVNKDPNIKRLRRRTKRMKVGDDMYRSNIMIRGEDMSFVMNDPWCYFREPKEFTPQERKKLWNPLGKPVKPWYENKLVPLLKQMHKKKIKSALIVKRRKPINEIRHV